MKYESYFEKFNKNDDESVIQYIPNEKAIDFLLDNAPRLYCPEKIIEETFAFRTWTMRKHIKKTEDGFVLTEFLVNGILPWAGAHNTINAPLTHHLNEFRWLKNADKLLDYITFFLLGEGSAYHSKTAFRYHTPALTAMYDFCILTGNEKYVSDNIEHFEKYFSTWEEEHISKNGLYWSQDNYEGTEYSISGTTPEHNMPKGFRPLMNSAMYSDAKTLGKIFRNLGDDNKATYYEEKAKDIKKRVDESLWDGEFYKAVHPTCDINLPITTRDIPEHQSAKELMGYIPWAFGLPDNDKSSAFRFMKDKRVFAAKTGLTTADMSHERFQFFPEHDCTWCGNVWPYATSYAINAVIKLLGNYEQNEITNHDLYGFIKKYAKMHKLTENGKTVNFIDEVMRHDEYIWHAREVGKTRGLVGGNDRGKDYNHSTFIDLVLRGLCGIDIESDTLKVNPKIRGIWKWFKIENLTYKKTTYDIYYDEDGTVFGKGIGVTVERG